MCRCDVVSGAERVLAEVLTSMRDKLAAMDGVDPAGIRIGPIDFGPSPVTVDGHHPQM
jgi:hypothetical protein